MFFYWPQHNICYLNLVQPRILVLLASMSQNKWQNIIKVVIWDDQTHIFNYTLFCILWFKKEIFLLMIYLNSVWYYASSVFVFFFDLRPLFTLQIFHACLAFSRVVNHAALSSSEPFIPSLLLMFYLLKVPDLCPFIDASLHAFFSVVKQVS